MFPLTCASIHCMLLDVLGYGKLWIPLLEGSTVQIVELSYVIVKGTEYFVSL